MRTAFLSLLLILAACSADNGSQERGDGVDISVWPLSYRADLTKGLEIKSVSDLNRHDLTLLAIKHGGRENERAITPSYLTCLDSHESERNYEVVSFGFSHFAGTRAASVDFAFDRGSDLLICADVFKPKE